MSMTRKLVLWGSLVALTAGVVLNTSLQTRQQEDKLAQINAQIKNEEGRIRVLTAEWHKLKNPERLEALVERHMPEMAAVAPTQMASLIDMPERLMGADAPQVAQMPQIAEPPKEKTLAVKASLVKKAPVASKPKVVQVAQRAKPKPQRDELAELISRHNAPRDEVLTVIERPSPRAGMLWANVEDLR